MAVCPRCGQEQFCPCPSCKERHKRDDVWEWDKTGNFIICCRCRLTAEASWWEGLEGEEKTDRGRER